MYTASSERERIVHYQLPENLAAFLILPLSLCMYASSIEAISEAQGPNGYDATSLQEQLS